MGREHSLPALSRVRGLSPHPWRSQTSTQPRAGPGWRPRCPQPVWSRPWAQPGKGAETREALEGAGAGFRQPAHWQRPLPALRLAEGVACAWLLPCVPCGPMCRAHTGRHVTEGSTEPCVHLCTCVDGDLGLHPEVLWAFRVLVCRLVLLGVTSMQ